MIFPNSIFSIALICIILTRIVSADLLPCNATDSKGVIISEWSHVKIMFRAIDDFVEGGHPESKILKSYKENFAWNHGFSEILISHGQGTSKMASFVNVVDDFTNVSNEIEREEIGKRWKNIVCANEMLLRDDYMFILWKSLVSSELLACQPVLSYALTLLRRKCPSLVKDDIEKIITNTIDSGLINHESWIKKYPTILDYEYDKSLLKVDTDPEVNPCILTENSSNVGELLNRFLPSMEFVPNMDELSNKFVELIPGINSDYFEKVPEPYKNMGEMKLFLKFYNNVIVVLKSEGDLAVAREKVMHAWCACQNLYSTSPYSTLKRLQDDILNINHALYQEAWFEELAGEVLNNGVSKKCLKDFVGAHILKIGLKKRVYLLINNASNDQKSSPQMSTEGTLSSVPNKNYTDYSTSF